MTAGVNETLCETETLNVDDTPHELSHDIWTVIYNSMSYSELIELFFERVEDKTYSHQVRDETQFIAGLIFHKSPTVTIRRIEEIIAEKIWDMDEHGTGPCINEVVSNLKIIFKSFHPLLSGIICSHINNVETNRNGKSSDASYSSSTRTLKFRNSHTLLKTYAHELAHTIQYSLGMKCDSGIDNQDADRDNWETEVQFNNNTKLATMIKEQWEEFVGGEIETLKSYQKTNFNEFFAVAFEYLYRPTYRSKLQEKQPKMKEAQEKIRTNPTTAFPKLK